MATAPNMDKAKKIWSGMTSEQQKSFMDKNKSFDFAGHGFALTAPKVETASNPPIQSNIQTPVPQNIQLADTNTFDQKDTIPMIDKVDKVDKIAPVKETPAVKTSKLTANTQNALLSKYKTAEELQASDVYKKWNTAAQKTALAAYQKKPTTTETNTNTQHKDTTAPVVDKSLKDDSQPRLDEITTNLTNYTQTNPDLFKSWTTLKNFLKYDDRSDIQKKTIDTFRLNKKRQDKLNSYSTDDLAIGVANGDFSAKDLDYLKASDPAKYQEYQSKLGAAQQQVQSNMLMASMNKLLGDSDKNGVMDYLDELEKKTEAKYQSMEDYVNAKNSPEMTTLNSDMTTLKTDIESLQDQQESIKAEVRAQYGSLPKGLVNSIISDRTQALQNDINDKIRNYNSKLGEYNSKMEQYQDNYKLETERLAADTEAFTQKMTLFNQLWGMNVQQQQLEQGKFTTTPDPLGRGYIVTNTKTGETTLKTFDEMGGGGGGGDLSSQSSQYPNEQSFKNNNPTGIKFTAASDALKQLWKDAGINFSNGSAATDGGSFVKFDTIEDGMRAYDIAMTQRWGNATVKTYLDKWGTKSSKVSGIDDLMGKKISSLTQEEKERVQSAQIKVESPGLWGRLFGGQTTTSTTDTAKIPLFNKYNSPTADVPDLKTLVGLGYNPSTAIKDFINDATNYKSSTQTSIDAKYKAYNNALKNIPLMTKQKEEFMNTMKGYLEEGDTENAKTLIINALSKSLGVDSVKPYELATSTLSILDSLGTDIKKFTDAGGNTNIFKGKWENLAKRVGTVSDPTLRALANRIAANMQQYRLKITGAAFSPEESAEYEALFPSIGSVPSLNAAVILGTSAAMKDNIKGFLKGHLQGNYEPIFGTTYDSTMFQPQQSSYFDTHQTIKNTVDPRTNTLKDLGINL